MVTLPAEGRWSLRSLSDDDAGPALAFLRRDPLVNVYLISRLLEERFVSATQTVEVRYNREIVLVASLATNVVMARDPDAPPEVTDAAIAMIAERILTRMLPVRAIISPAELVEGLWKRLHSRLDPPTVVRMSQPVYAIPRRGFSRALLREVCGHLARKGKSVTLFVNDFNRPAIALYESLGFRQIGVNRALIW